MTLRVYSRWRIAECVHPGGGIKNHRSGSPEVLRHITRFGLDGETNVHPWLSRHHVLLCIVPQLCVPFYANNNQPTYSIVLKSVLKLSLSICGVTSVLSARHYDIKLLIPQRIVETRNCYKMAG